MTGRHWMLLVGGLIVVALLFAPGGKKQLSAGSSPVQGSRIPFFCRSRPAFGCVAN